MMEEINSIINQESLRGGVLTSQLRWGFVGIIHTLAITEGTNVLPDGQLLVTDFYGALIIFEAMGDTIVNGEKVAVYVRPGTEVEITSKGIRFLSKVRWIKDCRFPTYQEVLKHTNNPTV